MVKGSELRLQPSLQEASPQGQQVPWLSHTHSPSETLPSHLQDFGLSCTFFSGELLSVNQHRHLSRCKESSH